MTSAVMEQLDINWARLLVNLFIEHATLISHSFNGDQLVKIEARRILHHGMKISFMLINHLPSRVWYYPVPVCEDHLVPYYQR